MKAILIFLLALSPTMFHAQEVNKTPGPDEGKVIFEEVVDAPEQDVYSHVEEMPIFMDGTADLYKYLAENIEYPAEALGAGIVGRVFVQFIVTNDGSINSAKVIKGIGAGCDQEALRVINAMPAWTPGKQHGQVVDVMFRVPIQFVLPTPSAE